MPDAPRMSSASPIIPLMLAELLIALRCRTVSRAARRLGYAREIAALEVRHARLADAWRNHVSQTRSALAQAAESARNPEGIALILGAGVMHDLPLSDCEQHFAETWLLDIAFSPATWSAARRSKGRLRCVPCDTTGIVDAIAERLRDQADLAIATRLPLTPPERLSFIASVNCLTQLPLLPAAWLLKHGVDDATAERIAKRLMLAHLEQLAMPGVPVCLISERADTRMARDAQCVARTDFMPLVAPALAGLGAIERAQWTWRVHPAGELPRGESETRTVSVWTF
jgi:hypothetical protein